MNSKGVNKYGNNHKFLTVYYRTYSYSNSQFENSEEKIVYYTLRM